MRCARRAPDSDRRRLYARVRPSRQKCAPARVVAWHPLFEPGGRLVVGRGHQSDPRGLGRARRRVVHVEAADHRRAVLHEGQPGAAAMALLGRHAQVAATQHLPPTTHHTPPNYCIPYCPYGLTDLRPTPSYRWPHSTSTAEGGTRSSTCRRAGRSSTRTRRHPNPDSNPNTSPAPTSKQAGAGRRGAVACGRPGGELLAPQAHAHLPDRVQERQPGGTGAPHLLP